MTPSEIINTIGLVVTFFTALATLLTVIELKKQRRNTYVPEVFIANCFIDFYGFDLSERYTSFSFSRKDNSQINRKYIDKPDDKVNSLFVVLNNIGFGTAKYFNYEWSFDLNKIFTVVKSVNSGQHFSMNYENLSDELEDGIIIETIDKKHYNWLSYNIDFRSESIDFVSPISISKAIYEIPVPRAYIEPLCYYLVLKYDMFSEKGKDFIHDELKDFPPLLLELNYQDLGKKKHTKTISFDISVSGIFTRNYEKPHFGDRVLGTFQIKTKEIH